MRNAWTVWMSALLSLSVAGTIIAQPDYKDCKDHPLFPTRMPDYRIEACKVEDFGIYEFFAVTGPKTPVEGRFTFITYAFTGERSTEPSGIAVVRNYESAIQKAGGSILGSKEGWWVNGKIVKDGQEAWVQAEKGNGKIWLRIVEKKAMDQYIVADAAALSSDIRATGHVAVYGINFDTGRSTIKPESSQAIAEIGKVLKSDTELKLFVVGHTDTVGSVDGNITLSQNRAQAVLQALVSEHGIDSSRLRAYGCGPFAPVASNDTEEGKAKNRRVELVKQ